MGRGPFPLARHSLNERDRYPVAPQGIESFAWATASSAPRRCGLLACSGDPPGWPARSDTAERTAQLADEPPLKASRALVDVARSIGAASPYILFRQLPANLAGGSNLAYSALTRSISSRQGAGLPGRRARSR